MINHLYILLELYPNAEWEYYWLSMNPNITWDIIQNNPTIFADYFWLSENPNITWDIMKANPDEDWYYEWLSSNPNITWDIVRNNPQIPWNYYWLSINKFNKDPYLVKKRLMNKYGRFWLEKTREHKCIRDLWMNEFSASMDILKLRQRDVELGVY